MIFDQVGLRFNNHRYHLDTLLGQGGMGMVYRAYDRLTQQHVALKQVVIDPETLIFNSRAEVNDPAGLLLALAQEFRILASLRHPHIISVLDYGFDAKRRPYFTMELLEQPQTLLQAGRGQPLAAQIELLIQLLQALAYLHRRGILHRDLKPENALVHAGRVRVLDFGLSVTHEQAQRAASSGTILYMAPEVFLSAPVTPASDLYAVGVIAYELLVGRHPFYSTDLDEFVDRWLNQNANLAPLANNQTLASVVGKLLARQPTERYQQAETVIRDLCTALGRLVPAESIAIRESFLQAATFVGRNTELLGLTAALAAAQRGRGSAWLVGGESGVGKSRLLDELRTQALVAGTQVLRGQAVEGGGQPYQLWRGVIPHLVLSGDLTDLDASVLKEVVPEIGRLLERNIPAAPALLGAAGQQRIAMTIAELFTRQSQPTVLLLEDLQWSSESLLPLQYLNRLVATLPLLIVANYRDDERPQLPTELPDMMPLPLKRLNEGEIAALSQSMLGELGGRSQILTLLQRETEGNVFFLVEVVRALAEESGGLAQIGKNTLPAQVFAGGIQRIIQRRLNQVPAWGQRLLHIAAVAGRQVDLRIINQLCRQEKSLVNSHSLDQWLTACADAAVLTVIGEQWLFAHDKLRESLLHDFAHPSLHRQVAQAMAAVYGDDERYVEPLTRHWLAAEEVVQALPSLCKAVARMVEITAEYPQAIEWIERGLPFAAPQQQAQLLAWRGHAAEMQSAYEQAPEYYHASLALAADNPQLRVVVLNRLSGVCCKVIRYPEARDYAQQALQLAREIEHRPGIAASLTTLGLIATQTGSHQDARPYLEESLAIYRSLGDRNGEARNLSTLGLVADQLREYATAETYIQIALGIAQTIGNRSMIAGNLINLGINKDNQGDHQAAYTYFQESMAIFTQIGDRDGVGTCWLDMGIALLYLGKYETAWQHVEQGFAISEQIGDIGGQARCYGVWGSLCYIKGDFAAARSYLEKSFTIFQEAGIQHERHQAAFELAVVLLQLGDLTTSRSLLAEMAQHALAEGTLSAQVPPLLAAAFLFYQEGNYVASTRYLGVIPERETESLRPYNLWPELSANLQTRLGIDDFTRWLAEGQQQEPETLLRQLLAERSAPEIASP